MHTTLVTRVVDRAAPENRASSVAGFTACWELGVGGGAIAVGGLADALGYYVMFLVVATLPLLGLRVSMLATASWSSKIHRSGGGRLSGRPARLTVQPPK